MAKKKDEQVAGAADNPKPVEQVDEQPDQPSIEQDQDQQSGQPPTDVHEMDEQQRSNNVPDASLDDDEAIKVRVLVDCFAGKCNTIATVKRSELPSLEGKVDRSPEAVAYVESLDQ